MNTQTRETPRQTARARPRRTWMIVLAAVLAVAVIGVGVWAIVAANQTDEIDIATDLVDDWIAAANASDPEAMAAVFTEDVREAELRSAHQLAPATSNITRTGDLAPTGADTTFSFPAQFDWGDGTYAGVWEIELEGDLAASIEGEWEQVIE